MPPKKRNEWSKIAMAEALSAVKNEGLSVRLAAAKNGVPKSSLGDRLSGRVRKEVINGKALLLSPNDEKLLKETAKQKADLGIGFSKKKRVISFKKKFHLKSGGPSSRRETMEVPQTFTRTVHAKCVNKDGVTILACGNASGKMLPANFIVKGKTKLALKSWDTETAPVGSYIGVSDSEWTKQVRNNVLKSTIVPNSFWSTEKRLTGDYHCLPLGNRAWVSISPEQLKNGFRSTGIYPLNPDHIPPEAYLLSTLYSKTMEEGSDKYGEKENFAE
ncbi:hypothetical protein KUTeg_008703, partial [Tegillarca granosa]